MYTIAILEDALSVLDTLVDTEAGLSLAEIVRRTGLSKNKAFRILYTLEQRNLVRKQNNGHYVLGVGCLIYGERARKQIDLIDAARPVMDRLVAETDETVFLGVLDGQQALCIDARESSKSIRLYARIGRRVPLHAGSIPKLLFAHLPDPVREQWLGEIELTPMTPYTVTDPDLLRQQLIHIRVQGYAITSNDLDEGATSVAAPIRDHTGRVVAALSVAGPSPRFSQERVGAVLALVLEGAAQISANLGYRPARRASEPEGEALLSPSHPTTVPSPSSPPSAKE